MKKLNYNEENLESLSNSDLKKLGDYWLRQYLLRTTAGMGDRYWCPLKKQSFHESYMQCCHYEDRMNLWTRYSLLNVHLLSSQSNMWDSKIMVEGFKSKHHKEYAEWLIKEYGVDVLDELNREAKRRDTFTKADYIKAINKFREDG